MPRPLNQTDTDLNAENLLRLPAEFGCPVWVYDAQIVREKIAALHQFDVVRFAQKACSNIHILRLMREQGSRLTLSRWVKSNVRWRPDLIRKPIQTRLSLLRI